MNCRAIILAAGRGSRMGEATALKPKCLNLLAGKELLEWQLESLSKANIDNITVVRGYRSDMLEGNYETVDNTRWNETNMVASLFCVSSGEKNQSTIISYSDIAYAADHIKRLNMSEHDITITADIFWEDLWKLRFENPLDDAETFKSKESKLLEIGGKTTNIQDIEAQYMGLIKLTQKGWKTMYDLFQSFSDDKKDKMDMTSMLNELLEKKESIHVVFVEGKWCEADNYSDIVSYENELNKNKNWIHDWR
jgi:choline kinase